jgi:hypothetical protein
MSIAVLERKLYGSRCSPDTCIRRINRHKCDNFLLPDCGGMRRTATSQLSRPQTLLTLTKRSCFSRLSAILMTMWSSHPVCRLERSPAGNIWHGLDVSPTIAN